MISASVGFQCPECVNKSRATVPRIRTGNTGLWQSLPLVTRTIIAACVGVYVVAWLTGLVSAEYTWGMSPIEVANGQWWRLLTATFLHASIMHILFNMYALLVLGSSLERALGQLRFATLYFMSALGGSVAALWFSSLNTISVGASGAIFGLMTATIVVGRRMNIDTSQIMFWLVLNVVIGFLSPAVDWRAHLGGAVVGAVTARILSAPVQASAKPSTQWLFLGLLLGLLIAQIVVRNHQILTYLNR